MLASATPFGETVTLMNEPLSTPNFEAMEAAITWIAGNLSEEDKDRYFKWFLKFSDKSGALAPLMLGHLSNQMDLPLLKQELVKFVSAEVEEWPEEKIRAFGLAAVACQFLFIGWHARGAVEQAEQLNKMAE